MKNKYKVKMTEGFKKDLAKLGFGGPYQPSFWEWYILWPLEGIWEKITYDIPHEIKWFIQRGKKGYADCDLWDLNSYLTDWLPEALRELAKNSYGCPAGLYDNKKKRNQCHKWTKILREMADSFEAGGKLMCPLLPTSKRYQKYEKKFNKGMKLFHKYFFSLWD